MIVGIGTDIVEIKRVRDSLARGGERFAQRILTPSEFSVFSTHHHPEVFLAKRFAAKEAAAKALGTGIGRGVSFQHIEIIHDEMGRPLLQLCDGALARLAVLGGRHTHISISDEQLYATAFVVLES